MLLYGKAMSYMNEKTSKVFSVVMHVHGNTKYKASELGIGRNLMISKLPSTWKKLHHQAATVIKSNTPQNHPAASRA